MEGKAAKIIENAEGTLGKNFDSCGPVVKLESRSFHPRSDGSNGIEN
jgi:hypothetical protein